MTLESKASGANPRKYWPWAATLLIACSTAAPLPRDSPDDTTLAVGDALRSTTGAEEAGFGLDGMPADAATLAEDGCSAVLADRATFPDCSGAPCDQVQREADRSVRWRLLLRLYSLPGADERELSHGEKVHQQACVLAALQRIGLAPLLGDSPIADDAGILVDARLSDIESVVHTRAIAAVELECAGDDCPRCTLLDEPACRANALCYPVLAAAFDAELSCQAVRYAGCYPGNAGCTAAQRSARRSDGSCWLFNDGCLPPGYEATNSQDPACGYATFDNAAECLP